MHELPASPGKASAPLRAAEAAARWVAPSPARLLPPPGSWLPPMALSVKTHCHFLQRMNHEQVLGKRFQFWKREPR